MSDANTVRLDQPLRIMLVAITATAEAVRRGGGPQEVYDAIQRLLADAQLTEANTEQVRVIALSLLTFAHSIRAAERDRLDVAGIADARRD